MVAKVQKVTDLDKDENTDKSGFQENEQVREQTRARIHKSEETNGGGIVKADKGTVLPVHTKDSTIESFNKLARSLVSPQEEAIKKRWFKSEDNETVTELIVFYFYRSILTFFYLVYSIYAIVEYSVNISKIKFLSMAYRSDDDSSIINADVNKLPKIPQRLATILNYKSEQEEGGGIEGLCNDGASITAWCVCSGIPSLTIYEPSGVLKKSVRELSDAIFKKFESYFGTENVPSFLIKVPHLNLKYAGVDGEFVDLNGSNSTSSAEESEYQIKINILSKVDGRQTIIELTRVMAQMTKNGELKKSDISISFLNHELKQLVGEEPDLIILFLPYLDLQGYPPWHIRLSEMYWEPDNEQVSYVVFLRALQKYSTCKVNVGR